MKYVLRYLLALTFVLGCHKAQNQNPQTVIENRPGQGTEIIPGYILNPSTISTRVEGSQLIVSAPAGTFSRLSNDAKVVVLSVDASELAQYRNSAATGFIEFASTSLGAPTPIPADGSLSLSVSSANLKAFTLVAIPTLSNSNKVFIPASGDTGFTLAYSAATENEFVGVASSYSHTIFVTSVSYFGDLGTLDQADARCQAQAASGSLTKATKSGTWKAILSNSTTNARDRILFVTGASIKNVLGEVVVNAAPSLWGGTLVNPILYTEKGTTLAKPQVWTASNADGTSIGSATDDNCGNWSIGYSGPGGHLGVSGDQRKKDSGWLTDGSSDCDITAAKAALYCINSNQ